MPDDILLSALMHTLKTYLSYEDSYIEFLLQNPNYVEKERINTIDDLVVTIYPKDHNPPHFHVKSKDRKIDAKFLIETGEKYAGNIGFKDLKKIRAFYQSPKGKILMEKVWQRYQD